MDTFVRRALNHANNPFRSTNTKLISGMKRCRWFFLWITLFLTTAVVNGQLTYRTLQVQYDSAWTFRNLQLIPVRYKGGDGAAAALLGERPLLFAEALLKRKIKLQEMPYKNGADLNWLTVTNHSKQHVVVQSGELVSGGKQDRMMGETKILAPGSTNYLQVYCIEKRRWDKKAKKFLPAGVADSELKKTMNIAKRQPEIWKEIDRQYAAGNRSGETFSYLNLYDPLRTDPAYMNYFLERYSRTDSTFAGYIFITGDKIISTELFSSASLTDITFKNMLSSYVQSVMTAGAPPVVPVIQMKEFMDKVLISETLQKAYIAAHGKMHFNEGRLIHLIAYPE